MLVPKQVHVLILAAFAATALPATAQWTHSPPPIDSAYWWTLSDSLTPAELRAELVDREAHQRRFIAAVTAQTGSPPPKEAVEHLKIYVTEPHLWPMHEVFETLALSWEPGGYPSERVPVDLAKAGISQPAIDEILRVCEKYSAARAQAVEEKRERLAEWMELLRRAEALVGKDRLDEAVSTDEPDLDLLARATGRTSDDLGELHRVWYTDTLSSLAVEAIESLRASLVAEDWSLLRMYFLHELAPQMSAVKFQE